MAEEFLAAHGSWLGFRRRSAISRTWSNFLRVPAGRPGRMVEVLLAVGGIRRRCALPILGAVPVVGLPGFGHRVSVMSTPNFAAARSIRWKASSPFLVGDYAHSLST
jgi:hypothetical protein